MTPLDGLRVVVTRAEHQAEGLAAAFRQAGASVDLLPLEGLEHGVDRLGWHAALRGLADEPVLHRAEHAGSQDQDVRLAALARFPEQPNPVELPLTLRLRAGIVSRTARSTAGVGAWPVSMKCKVAPSAYKSLDGPA